MENEGNNPPKEGITIRQLTNILSIVADMALIRVIDLVDGWHYQTHGKKE